MSHLVQKLTDHAALIRKMDAIANAGGTMQTSEPTARLLDQAARSASVLQSVIHTLNDAGVTDYEGFPISDLNVLQGVRRALEAGTANAKPA